MTSSIALLVIGELDQAGQISLESMSALKVERICVAANDPGRQWLLATASVENLRRICLHQEIVQNFEYQQLNEKVDYSPYRTRDFQLLTILKWDLIKDIFQRHNSVSEVLFSDLDVYWLQDPQKRILAIKKRATSVLVQPDSTTDRPNKICTGIMSWHRSSKSLATLELIRSFHANKILLGEIQDDEDTFNQLMYSNTIDAETQRLPDQEFVIGNKFQKMILRSIFFRHSQPFCFHANYVIGLNRKLEFLIAVQNFYEHGTWPWRLFIRITKSRISSRLMGLSRNLKNATRLNI